jgi:hypothetical protein
VEHRVGERARGPATLQLVLDVGEQPLRQLDRAGAAQPRRGIGRVAAAAERSSRPASSRDADRAINCGGASGIAITTGRSKISA